MNYQKLDASLAMALNDVSNQQEANLVVFIHTKAIPNAEAIAVLQSMGVSNISSDSDVFTATLSPNAISQLSEQPWVQYIKLSQKLRSVKK
ncbi:MAG: hypothetical protein KME64_04435 [Scytonematopsis contorta HA4267-MV1]|jgi:hypothetical protein|nr:hypothetical protein [Scytonematopsis contorta HA4267-MV1]